MSPPRSAAPRDHPAVHGNPGEPAVHRRARPPHPGRVPAVLRPAALRRTIPMKCVLVFTQCDEATHYKLPALASRISSSVLFLFSCLVPFISLMCSHIRGCLLRKSLICCSAPFFFFFFVFSLVYFYLLAVLL